MRKQAVRAWMCVVVAVFASVRAEAECVDPATLARSTVNIVRIFGKAQESPVADPYGIAGTAWFLSPRFVVTAAHVADAMRLSEREWTKVEIHERESKTSFPVRIVHRLGSHAEKIAVLELGTPFSGATALPTRAAPLVADEPVLSLAYPDLKLRYAGGRFVRLETDDALAGAALLEMYDGTDRLVLDHGASGAPVLDCDGRVVAVVTNVLSQTVDILSQTIRVSTPWQTPNVVAVPIGQLGPPLGSLIPAR
jgi:Trypsin-like peptidase domain